jgi:hypothetical protein
MGCGGKILWLEQIQNTNKTFAVILDAIILDNIFINNKNNKLLNNYALHFSCIKIIKINKKNIKNE